MKSKLKIIIPVLLIAMGGVYKFVLAKPAAEAKKKVDGEVYILPKDFLVNLKDGRFAKLNVALVLKPGTPTTAAPAGKEAPAAPPEGFGTLPQEALVRDIVTNTLTDASGAQLTSRDGRKTLKHKVLRSILAHTDVTAESVLFTDVAVQ